MSPILSSCVTAAGGVLAGLALAGPLLWRLQRKLTRARHDATHDDTTGLPNRRAFLARLRAALYAGRPVGVVLLDLDRFKTVNDRFGHEAGNQVLVEVGRRLAALTQPCRSRKGPVELAARLSGDEYALLVHGDRDRTVAAAHAAWQAINGTPITIATQPTQVTASVGYATAGLGVTAAHLLRRADEAMYQAKFAGPAVVGAAVCTADTEKPWPHRPRDRRADTTPATF